MMLNHHTGKGDLEQSVIAGTLELMPKPTPGVAQNLSQEGGHPSVGFLKWQE
jgi:hypothetical protein